MLALDRESSNRVVTICTPRMPVLLDEIEDNADFAEPWISCRVV